MAGPHIFISYARAEPGWAERLEHDLLARGYPVWRDTRGIPDGHDFTSAIEEAINASSHLLVCLTPSIANSAASFVRREVQYARFCSPTRASAAGRRRPRPSFPSSFPKGVRWSTSQVSRSSPSRTKVTTRVGSARSFNTSEVRPRRHRQDRNRETHARCTFEPCTIGVPRPSPALSPSRSRSSRVRRPARWRHATQPLFLDSPYQGLLPRLLLRNPGRHSARPRWQMSSRRAVACSWSVGRRPGRPQRCWR